MKKLQLLLFVIAFNYSITKAQCPIGATALQSRYAQCTSTCGVLLIGWPEGTLVNIYGGTPLTIVTSAIISGTLGGGGTGTAFICVPCNIPLIFASSSTNATTGCVIVSIGVVPVKLTNFNVVNVADGSCRLGWTASNETGLVKYVVQRSADGRNFTDVSTLSSYNNNAAAVNYNYKDAAAIAGNNYYRLKIIENSGSIAYSETLVVKKQGSFGLSIYPNPSTTNFNIGIPEKMLPATLDIYNAQGQQVYTFYTRQSNFTINKQLRSGVYTVKVTANNHSSITQKIIKK